MSDFPKCLLCGCDPLSGGQLGEDIYVRHTENGCPVNSMRVFKISDWTKLMGRGEPACWMYVINGVHVDFSTIEPPDDAYDAGTLVPLYSRPVAAADDTARLSWLIRKLSGKALREMGVIYSAGSNTIRAAIDAAIKGEG